MLNTLVCLREMGSHLISPTSSILKVLEMCVSNPSIIMRILHSHGRLRTTHHTLESAVTTYIYIWTQLTIFGCKCKPFYLFTARRSSFSLSSHPYLSPLTVHTQIHTCHFSPSVLSYCIIFIAF